MKVLIVFATLLALAFAWAVEDYTIKTEKDLEKFRKECGKELRIADEKLEKLKKWEFDEKDEQTRCYIKCTLSKLGLFNESENEGPMVENFTKQLAHVGEKSEEEIRKGLKKCADKIETKDDACTWATRFLTCYMAKNKQLMRKSLKKD